MAVSPSAPLPLRIRSPPTAPASTGRSRSNRSRSRSIPNGPCGPRPGYLPVRFDITNLGEPRVIEIVGQGTAVLQNVEGWQPGGIASGRAVRLARGDRVRLTIPVPIFADNESIRFEIREDGRVLERFNYTGFQSRQPPG